MQVCSVCVWVGVVALAAIVASKPCPDNAVFVHDDEHGSVCGCTNVKDVCHGTQCVELTTSHLVLRNEVAFKAECMDCYCADKDESLSSVEVKARFPYTIVETTDDVGHMRDFKDELFEETCRQHDLGGPIPRPVALKRIQWLHFPKCGTSLTSTIYHYACRNFESQRVIQPKTSKTTQLLEDYKKLAYQKCYDACGMKCGGFTTFAPHDGLVRGQRWKDGSFLIRKPIVEKVQGAEIVGSLQAHYPLKEKSIKFHGVTSVAMFRDPRTRLVSAFNYDRHSFGMNQFLRRQMLQSTPELKDYVYFPGIQGCQTKMLAGFTCAQNVTITDDIFKKALNALEHRLAFIGLSEHWNGSVCLFHRMYGSSVHLTELANLRKGVSLSENGKDDKAENEPMTESEDDQEDTASQPGAGGASEKTGRHPLGISDDDANGDEEDDDAASPQSYRSGDKGDGDEDDDDEGSDSKAAVEKEQKIAEHALRVRLLSELTKVPRSDAYKLTKKDDPYDWAVYERAVELFLQRLEKYRFARPKHVTLEELTEAHYTLS
eukprot:m.45757 g.45757  ORF g.45757 m.45757 type:complete len:545 (+) comp10895_c0_seq1:315-1949(+)